MKYKRKYFLFTLRLATAPDSLMIKKKIIKLCNQLAASEIKCRSTWDVFPLIVSFKATPIVNDSAVKMLLIRDVLQCNERHPREFYC